MRKTLRESEHRQAGELTTSHGRLALNHHGSNPAMAQLSGTARRTLLSRENRNRATGEWGEWEHLNPQEVKTKTSSRSGWVLDVRAVYRNRVFAVLERLDATGVIHVAVSSLSGIRPTWYEMQRIKDELFGTGSTAVEIYPPAAGIVDGSDMFHIWVLPGEISFGLTKINKTKNATTVACELLMRTTEP